ncbi:MAG TPA: prolyl oligopeptidase family serine peptidase [Candidatus Limnocylindrales bacterium]
MTADAIETAATPAPWEARFRAPRTLWVRIAAGRPDRGLACTNRMGAYQIERWDVSSGTLEPVTNDPNGKIDGYLSPDGEWVVWHNDDGGNELGHFVAQRWDGGEVVDVTPAMHAYASFSAGFSSDGWFAASTVADDLAQLVVVPWSADGPREPVTLDPGPGFVAGLQLGRAGDGPDDRRPLAYATTGGEGLATILRIVDAADGHLLHEVRHGGAAVMPVAYADDGTGRLLASTTRSGAVRPLIVDRHGAERDYDLPDIGGEATPLSISPDGRRALVLSSARAIQRLHVLDLDSGISRVIDGATGSMAPNIPGAGTFFAPDGSIVVTREDAATLPEVVEIDADTGERRRVLIPAPSVPRSRPFRSIDVPSTDGAIVQGWLAVPEGEGPFPTILETHGGPQWNETDRFHPIAQAFVDEGFAFFTLNYRGSTGFGRDYEQAIWGRVGRCEIDDMVAAREVLVGTGVAKPDAVIAMGASYGGYLTLLALGRRPDLWAAGIGVVAIADWRLMHEDGPSLREYQEALFQGTPDETPELHVEASPITYVQDLAAPLLIIQGRNDTRCPTRQMEVYLDAAKRLGKAVEIHWFDAGHGVASIDMRIADTHRSIDFAKRVIDPMPA